MARSGKGGGMSAMIQRPTPGFQGSVFNRGQQPFVVQGTPAGQAGVGAPATNTPPWQNVQPQGQSGWGPADGYRRPSINVGSGGGGLFGNGPVPIHGGPNPFAKPNMVPAGPGMMRFTDVPWMNQTAQRLGGAQPNAMNTVLRGLFG